jgi:hypothetical protein
MKTATRSGGGCSSWNRPGRTRWAQSDDTGKCRAGRAPEPCPGAGYSHKKPIIVRMSEKISIADKMAEQENCAAKAMRHCGEFLPVWMVYGIHEAECRAPGSTKHEPGICRITVNRYWYRSILENLYDKRGPLNVKGVPPMERCSRSFSMSATRAWKRSTNDPPPRTKTTKTTTSVFSRGQSTRQHVCYKGKVRPKNFDPDLDLYGSIYIGYLSVVVL